MSEDFPRSDEYKENDIKGADGKYDKPEVGKPAFDPVGLPDNIKDPIELDYDKGTQIPTRIKDPTLTKDVPDNTNEVNDEKNYDRRDFPDPKGPSGGDFPPTLTGANAMPLPPEMDPKAVLPIQEMPRQPLIHIEQGQQR